jgi:capsular polysaccharide biosynthesis protein
VTGFYERDSRMRTRNAHRTTVLIGMHGSGMVNALYLFSGSVLVQLMPYKTGLNERNSPRSAVPTTHP